MEVNGDKLSQEEVAKSVEFCMRIIGKVDGTMDLGTVSDPDRHGELTCDRIKKEELKAGLREFGADVVNGMTVKLQRGALGLATVGTD